MKLSLDLISNFSKLSNSIRLKNGTHHFLSGKIQKEAALKRVKMGTHHFQNKDWHQKEQKKRVENGTHPSLKYIKCPNCHRSIQGLGAAKRWHFNNCRSQ